MGEGRGGRSSGLSDGARANYRLIVLGIDVARVSDWLTRNVDGLVEPFTFETIEGGRSNLTYRVTDASGTRFVLRRPPLGHVLATAHDMAREHRIISAVGTTSVPVPTTLGLCEDESVNGAPFYVMSFVDGEVLDSPERAAHMTPDVRRAAALHLIDVLADLHAADVDAIGLGDLAKRDGYVERQVRRWSSQWEQSKTRDLPAVDEVARRLAAAVPSQQAVAVAHGDFRFGNCLTDTATGRIAAVLDWELCTLGDPLADLGYLGVYWAGGDPARARHNDPTGLEGFPSYEEIVGRYADRSGLDVDGIDYYVAFSCFRLAAISEGVYARYIHGAMGDEASPELLATFRTAVEELADRALESLGS
jgi:aminoglycoside phosphotransferase (APT) family kinase protein